MEAYIFNAGAKINLSYLVGYGFLDLYASLYMGLSSNSVTLFGLLLLFARTLEAHKNRVYWIS